MTFTLDPNRDWESAWEQKNPEPYPEPKHADLNGHVIWWTPETLERIAWHKARWEAFKVQFPDWMVGMYT